MDGLRLIVVMVEVPKIAVVVGTDEVDRFNPLFQSTDNGLESHVASPCCNGANPQNPATLGADGVLGDAATNVAAPV